MEAFFQDKKIEVQTDGWEMDWYTDQPMDMNRYEVLYACDQRERQSACVRCVFVRLCVRELERMREKSVCVCEGVCVCV